NLLADALSLRDKGDELTINVSHALAQGLQRHIIARHDQPLSQVNTLLSGGLRLRNERLYRALTRSPARRAPRRREPLAGRELAAQAATQSELHGPRNRGTRRTPLSARRTVQGDSAAARLSRVLYELSVAKRAPACREPAGGDGHALGRAAPAGSSRR